MRDASDAQLDAPFIRVDDEKKTAAYGPEQKPDSLGILFDAIIGWEDAYEPCSEA